MRSADLLSETITSLMSNKVRSGLTILGIVVGIAAVILMVSIGQGAQASITSSINSAGANLLTVMPGGERRFGPGGDVGPNAGAKLTMSDAEAIAELPSVGTVSPQAQGQYAAATPASSGNTRVTGVTAAAAAVSSIDTSMGVFITDQDSASMAKVAVLGPTAVTNYFGEGVDPLGQTIRIKGIRFTVVGVTQSKGGSSFMNSDAVVYVPLSTMQAYLKGDQNLDNISVEAKSSDAVDSAKTEITQALLTEHRITDSTKADFSIQSQADILSTASTITGTFTALLAAIASISLLVGGIGIMNMMLTTVTERTREIGLRKALGARRTDITSQFLAEAVTLCVTGGLLGIALGWGAAAIVSATGLMTTQVSVSAVILAVSVCAGIGVVFGFYPARRAAKLDPIEALRYQ